jgi:SpoVK/Ycf46/Vps4 family AAA+-type ATPase
MNSSSHPRATRNEGVALLGKVKLGPPSSCLRELLPALARLDALLSRAAASAQEQYGPGSSADRFRGLHISNEDVSRLLARTAATPLLCTNRGTFEEQVCRSADELSRLAWLQQTFELSSFDIDVVLIALAPELDLRYECLYAYLQDDVTKKRPTVDLALNLLSESAVEKITQRNRFGSGAPLIRQRLVRLISDPNMVRPPLLAHYLKLDDQIIRFLLGQTDLDSRLAACCELEEAPVSIPDLPLRWEIASALPRLAKYVRQTREPMSLCFHGPQSESKIQTAKALAAQAGKSILAMDLARAARANAGLSETVRLAVREAWFGDSLLFLDGARLSDNERQTSLPALLEEVLGDSHGITVLATEESWIPAGRTPARVVNVPFPVPQFSERQECWKANTTQMPIQVEEVSALASRFHLTAEQIVGAVSAARSHALWRSVASSSSVESSFSSDHSTTLDDLFLGARAQCGQELAAVAKKVNLVYSWNDIVLPADTVLQLREMCDRVTHRERVFSEWGFERKLSLGKGVNALFAGPSGTGKTMAAEIIANELGLDLYKIDLSGVISKYIGDTEKNLDRIFKAAENANAILLFDEADALFGKRSEVRDSHDRYANIEVSYLLQKMEEYEGISILASNHRQYMDESFIRRLAFTVLFPFPDAEDRYRIWARVWPAGTPLSPDLDLSFIANRFKFSGGNIKNVALAAAFLAASNGGLITMQHLFHATQREYEKMGKRLTEVELYGEHSKQPSASAVNEA